MPRNVSGVYSKPCGTTAVSGEVIASATYTLLINDLVADLNTPRPIVAGGTGATDAATARVNFGLEVGADVQAQDDFLQNLADLDLAGSALKFFQVNAAEDNVQLETILPVNSPSGNSLKFLRANAAETAAEFVDFTSQADWNAGISDAENAISPAKLSAVLDNKLNVSGSAPAFACRAFISFNGFTSTIGASGNVSNLVRDSTGTYTITFTEPMPDLNFAVSATGSQPNASSGGQSDGNIFIVGRTESALTIRCGDGGSSGSSVDLGVICVTVHR